MYMSTGRSSSWFSAWWLIPSSKKSKIWKGLQSGKLWRIFLLWTCFLFSPKKWYYVIYETVKMETLNDMGIVAYKYKTTLFTTSCLWLRCELWSKHPGIRGLIQILIAMVLIVTLCMTCSYNFVIQFGFLKFVSAIFSSLLLLLLLAFSCIAA